ncbi:hydroxyacylglutathione hydrolase [Hoeflea marina]|uniref:Hydroxyacylglutathione hydrolase n=1 Tax=Hoeflea marina TaxID=274592 RepID=A0A317PCN1_9HYPH|nr:MBL fold metallo-hydrolase [Hoeflea marina]PWV97091.1 hydroxyacylglutathione hydrolase [Hoeflea marina]
MYAISILRLGPAHFQNLVYIVYDVRTRHAVIVDPAWDEPAITAACHSLGLTLRGILVTHSHSDHVSALTGCIGERSVPVLMSRSEAERIGLAASSFLDVQNAAEYRLGSLRVKAIMTPGHTSGSICYLTDQALFTGDTLFIEGCGDCSSEEGSVHDMWESIQRLKACIDGDVLVYPGHQYESGPGARFSSLLENNIYLRMKNRDTFAAFAGRKSLRGENG